MGGAQVNTDGYASLVRVRRLAGFGYLEKCHVAFSNEPSLSQQVELVVHLTGKTLYKHKASDLLGRCQEVLFKVNRMLYF